jgi:hypothetical protein
MKRGRKTDGDLERFQADMDGLAEKPQIIRLMREGCNAKEICRRLGISHDMYRHFWESDVEFRAQLYAAVSHVSVDELLASVDDES